MDTGSSTASVTEQLSMALGCMSGWIVAPWFALVSFARAARTFHPRGVILHASVRRHPAAPAELHVVAERLLGRALVRFSAALWKRAEHAPDVLGCAIRLRRSAADDLQPAGDDQDLLFATIRRPWTMFFAPLTTRVSDYLQNDYYAVSPFDVAARRVYLRLHPRRASHVQQGTRSHRLSREIELGACLDLELSSKPFGPWRPVVEVELERVVNVGGDSLRFSPFRAGRGLQPHGFVHAMRRGVYAASQRGRDVRADPTTLEPRRNAGTA
jgi:hypothetical protein